MKIAVLWLAIGLLSAFSGAQAPIRTGDITVRGLSEGDCPRVTTLADNVYAYEQIDPTKRVYAELDGLIR